MSAPLFHVDAFTAAPFAGNPAAVVLLPSWPDDIWLARVAAEMNLSETAYVVREPGAASDFRLRWFTPAVEVDLCGHATLAAAHVLWGQGEAPVDRAIAFHTRSGILGARRAGELIELDFPLLPDAPGAAPPGLASALGREPKYVGGQAMDLLVELESEAEVRGLTPNFSALKEIPVRGVIVTAVSSDPRYDFVSRFFAPRAGVDEDPVTGSAHCRLAAFWRRRLGKAEFLAYQASRRGGEVRVRIEGDRVKLGGQATTIAEGRLCV
jgi:predicted PhzF superfamily epimerase YddE/YHI9